MTKLLSILACSALAFAQSPKFEAADVHVSALARNPYMRGPYIRAGLYEILDATMLELVSAAYGIHSNLVSGGPAWLEMDRFDIVAKPPAKSSPEELRAMLLETLRERFQLTAHKDTVSMPAFALTAGKHPNLKRSEADHATGCDFVQSRQNGGAPLRSFNCHGLTMAEFAEELAHNLGAARYFNDAPVLDRTALDGRWGLTVSFSPPAGGIVGADRLTVFEAVDKQLGLKLEAATAPVQVIVVDKVSRKPSDNPPGAREALETGPLPTEFEVADIKLTDPSYRGLDYRLLPSGQLNVRGVSLQFLITQAWDIPPYMLTGAPSWINEDRYDIVAKAPRAAMVYEPGAKEPDLDDDSARPMLQSLLAERFGLVAHMENRPMEAYTLIAVKPHMNPADPNERTRFREGSVTNGKDPRNNSALNRLVTCQNMTMEQFGRQLQQIAAGYIHAPVLDKTGLTGSYDFTLSFSGAGVLRNGRGGRGGRGGGDGQSSTTDPAMDASDPGGGISLFDAVEKQLGLKLVKDTRPIPVLVIDEINRKPTEN